MNVSILEQTQSRQYQSIRKRLEHLLCESVIQGSSLPCSDVQCTKIHQLEKLSCQDLCEFRTCCTVQGCPFRHQKPQVSSWYDMEDDEDDDIYNLLEKMERGNSTLYAHNELSLLDEVRKLRASSPILSSFEQLVQVFSLAQEEKTKGESSLETQLSLMKLIGQEGELKMYHQDDVNNFSPLADRQRRGWIVKDQTLVVKTFPTSREISVGHPHYEEWVREVLPNSIILKSYEGSLLRLWKCPGEEKWRISTVRKIDAAASRWNANPSFGQRLIESIEVQTRQSFEAFCFELKSNYVYTFWLTTDAETKSICKNEAQHVYSLGCFDRDHEFEYSLCTFPGIPFPPRIETLIFTPGDLAIALEDKNNQDVIDLKIQGYTILNLNGEMLKVSSEKYRNMYLVRGRKVSNNFVKYIELYGQDERQQLLDLYPEQKERLLSLDRKMSRLIDVLYRLYHKDLAKRRLPLVEREEFKVYRKLFVDAKKTPLNKEEIRVKLCSAIRDDSSGDMGRDVLRALETAIQMLPSPNAPRPIPSERSYYPIRIQFGSKQKDGPREPSTPPSSSVSPTSKGWKIKPLRFGKYSPRVTTPSPTLSPSTTPIASPLFDEAPSPVSFSKNISTSLLGLIRPVTIGR